MAEDKRTNPFPHATMEEIDAVGGSREQRAARFISARRFGGIPTRGYLLGTCDHSPMMKGIVDLTTACFALLDALPEDVDGPVRETATALYEMLTVPVIPARIEPETITE